MRIELDDGCGHVGSVLTQMNVTYDSVARMGAFGCSSPESLCAASAWTAFPTRAMSAAASGEATTTMALSTDLGAMHELWAAWIVVLVISLGLCTFGTPRGSFLQWRTFLRLIDFRTDVAPRVRRVRGDGRYRELPDDGRFMLATLRRERHSVTGGYVSLALFLFVLYGAVGVAVYVAAPSSATLVAVADSSGPGTLAAALLGAHTGYFGLGGVQAARDYYLAGRQARDVTYAAYQVGFEVRPPPRAHGKKFEASHCEALTRVSVSRGHASVTHATEWITHDAPGSDADAAATGPHCRVVATVRLQLHLDANSAPSFDDAATAAGAPNSIDRLLSVVSITFARAEWQVRRAVVRASILDQAFGQGANGTSPDPWVPVTTLAQPDPTQCSRPPVQQRVFAHATACPNPAVLDQWQTVPSGCLVRSARLSFLSPLNAPWRPTLASLAFDESADLAAAVDPCLGTLVNRTSTGHPGRALSVTVGVRATGAIIAQVQQVPSVLAAVAQFIVIVGVAIAIHPVLRKIFKLSIVRGRSVRRLTKGVSWCPCRPKSSGGGGGVLHVWSVAASGFLGVALLGVPLVVLGPARTGVEDASLASAHALTWMLALVGALLITITLSLFCPCARAARVGVVMAWFVLCVTVAVNVATELLFSNALGPGRENDSLISAPLAWLQFACAGTLAASLGLLLLVAWRHRRHQGTYGVTGISNPLLLYDDDDDDDDQAQLLGGDSPTFRRREVTAAQVHGAAAVARVGNLLAGAGGGGGGSVNRLTSPRSRAQEVVVQAAHGPAVVPGGSTPDVESSLLFSGATRLHSVLSPQSSPPTTNDPSLPSWSSQFSSKAT